MSAQDSAPTRVGRGALRAGAVQRQRPMSTRSVRNAAAMVALSSISGVALAVAERERTY